MGRVRGSIAFVMIVAVGALARSPRALADRFNTEVSSSTRAMGMGNAAVNTERGAYAVFYNPANIAAKDTRSNIQLLNMTLEGSDGLFQMASAGTYSFLSLSSMYSTLKDMPNTMASGRFSVYPNATFRNFSLGMLYEVNQGAMVRASDGALLVRARNRFAPTVAFSARLASGIFRIGAAAHWLTVGAAETWVPAPASVRSLDFKSYTASGTGLVANGGITLSLPVRFLPSFSFVARNIGNTKYTGASLVSFGDIQGAGTQKMTFDFAAAMTIYLARRLELKLEADYRDYFNKLEGGRFRHVFAGAEMILYDFMHLRAGIQHGYVTYGFGIHTKRAALDLAVYSDELEDRLRGAPEQRYALQYSWSLFR